MDVVFDPAAPDFPARAHAVFRRMRDDHPLYRDPVGGSYALSRFADVRAAALDWRTYSSEGKAEGQYFKPTLNGTDPPRSTRLRSLIAGAFTTQRVAALEPEIRKLARRLFDALPDHGPCDLIGAFAALLPSMVTGRLIGLPEERWAECREITDRIMHVRSVEDYEAPANDCYALFGDLIELRRRNPQDDLFSALLQSEIDGERLTDDELLAFGFVLLIGGNDTTTNLIGNGLELLARHPDARHRLRDDPALVPGAVEEMLRIASPTHSTPRMTTRDVELPYGTIPEGSRVLLLWAAANLDEREFDDPERFDIDRRPDRHLAFGLGTHLCLGAGLARLEARIAFEELLPRLGNYELVAAPEPVVSALFTGFESLIVAIPSRATS